jgi:hypothetical protein
VDLRFADPIIFGDLKLPQFRKYIIFILTNIILNGYVSSLRKTFGFWESYMAFRSLNYSYVGKENMRGKPLRTWIRNTAFSWHICGFAIWRGHQGNLWIWDLRVNHYKFVDLRFSDWHTSEICGLAIAE